MKCVIVGCQKHAEYMPPAPHNGSMNGNLTRALCDLHYFLLIDWVFNFFGREYMDSTWTAEGQQMLRLEKERMAEMRLIGPMDMIESVERPRPGKNEGGHFK